MSDTRAAQIMKAYTGRGAMSAPLAARIVTLADKLGAGAFDLANLLHFESGFQPAVQNKITGATGLIQFMPSTAKGLGTTTAALAAMSALEQMEYVEKYLRKLRPPYNTVQGLFMAVFYPVARKEALTWTFPSAVQKANPGIRVVDDYINLALRKAKLPRGGHAPTAMASTSGLEPQIHPVTSTT